LTILLSDRDVESLLDMGEVVSAVEKAFRAQGTGVAQNYMRTRTGGVASVLNVMHANNSYQSRGGLKAYMSSKGGTRFVVALFDTSDSSLLAIMGADMLGRFRTGAASGVATKHLYAKRSAKVALFGSGKQALTQALALGAVLKVEEFRVWSPKAAHRNAFTNALKDRGLAASASDSVAAAAKGADVVSGITSSKEPYLDVAMLGTVSHANICGGNVPDRSEITARAVGAFGTVVVDDLPQAKIEYGDLIRAEKAGTFRWESAVELGAVVAGKKKPAGKTLFKSGGAAIEDVAAANLVYEKAKALGRFPDFQFH
jgi:alanine dehydrogenase